MSEWKELVLTEAEYEWETFASESEVKLVVRYREKTTNLTHEEIISKWFETKKDYWCKVMGVSKDPDRGTVYFLQYPGWVSKEWLENLNSDDKPPRFS